MFATETPTLTLTATSSPTPVHTPTETTIPTPTIQAGWDRFNGVGFSIDLPVTYIGGSGERELEQIVDFYRQLGNEEQAQNLETNAGLVRMLAIDTDPDSILPGATNLTVILEESLLVAAVPLDQLALQVAEQASQQRGLEPGEQQAFIHGSLEGHRVILSGSVAQVIGIDVEEDLQAFFVLYLLRNERRLWVLTFTTVGGDADLQLFDQAVRSFQEDS